MCREASSGPAQGLTGHEPGRGVFLVVFWVSRCGYGPNDEFVVLGEERVVWAGGIMLQLIVAPAVVVSKLMLPLRGYSRVTREIGYPVGVGELLRRDSRSRRKRRGIFGELLRFWCDSSSRRNWWWWWPPSRPTLPKGYDVLLFPELFDFVPDLLEHSKGPVRRHDWDT
jgi:hypothetical protein